MCVYIYIYYIFTYIYIYVHIQYHIVMKMYRALEAADPHCKPEALSSHKRSTRATAPLCPWLTSW